MEKNEGEVGRRNNKREEIKEIKDGSVRTFNIATAGVGQS